ncbi:MAG: trypsin-like peptidase domain-containing protein [Gammaproteobacteria bacterium]|nr:trypsin-like peptidase domain-containing protein [Gammaproteobacteria bacterium]
MISILRLSLLVLVGVLILPVVASTDASNDSKLAPEEAHKNAQQLFHDYRNRLYQVRTIDKASGSKAAIGSAFAVAANGVLATNYHVVSKYILKPEKYSITVVDHADVVTEVTVIKLDVINDLALLQLPASTAKPVIRLAEHLPQQGESIFSLGNPRDLGMTVVPGTFNGITAYSVYDRVLFSGSINPGMSGGPVLNESGELIGVNVATSGNALSFLVPLNKLRKLINEPLDDDLRQQALSQLTRNQDLLMAKILASDWQTAPLGQAQVLAEMSDFISCWGESDTRPKEQFQQVFRRCRNSEYIYMAPDFYTGIYELEFYFYSTEKLSTWQFYRMLNDSFASVSAGNIASEDHVSEFNCRSDFVAEENSSKSKAVYCVREYRQYPGLYDVLFLAATISDSQSSLVSHYTLSGISQENAQKFLAKFLEVVL